jgi:hypothetical protein
VPFQCRFEPTGVALVADFLDEIPSPNRFGYEKWHTTGRIRAGFAELFEVH